MLEAMLERHLARKLHPERIRRHVQKNRPASVSAARTGPAPGLVRVSCVQRQIRPVRRVEEYVDRLHGFVRQAAEQGSRLVVFPEYNFFDLFGLLPGFTLLERLLSARAQKTQGSAKAPEQITHEQETGGSPGGPFYTLLSAVARPVEETLLAAMSELAMAYGLYIYTGSYLVKEGGHLYNAGSLIAPHGQVIGTQKKMHLMDFEAELGLARGTELKVYDLDIGRIAFPVCMDATYFETFRLARQLGADLVIIPIANNEEYNLWKALRGIWPRVQESYVFGLKSSLNGWLAGMHFTGKAGIFAPIEMTEGRDGVLAIAHHFEGDELVTADLDCQRLRRAREEAEYFGDRNPVFEADYYVKTYVRGEQHG